MEIGRVHRFEFKSHVLSQRYVDERKKDGLISPNIDLLIERIIQVYPSCTFGPGGNISSGFLESIGIKESFFAQRASRNSNAISFDSIHITDFYLIHCSGYFGNREVPPKLKFIPLEYVDYCVLTFDQNYSGSIAPTFKTIEKSPVKGAVIGGIIGGTTGAVIGAAASSGTKTVLNTPGHSYNDNSYNLSIKIKGDTPQTIWRFYECKNTPSNTEIVKQKNQTVQMIIERAKLLDINEKKNLAREENIRKWKIAGRCQYCGGLFKGLFKKKCIDCGHEKDY